MLYALNETPPKRCMHIGCPGDVVDGVCEICASPAASQTAAPATRPSAIWQFLAKKSPAFKTAFGDSFEEAGRNRHAPGFGASAWARMTNALKKLHRLGDEPLWTVRATCAHGYHVHIRLKGSGHGVTQSGVTGVVPTTGPGACPICRWAQGRKGNTKVNASFSFNTSFQIFTTRKEMVTIRMRPQYTALAEFALLGAPLYAKASMSGFEPMGFNVGMRPAGLPGPARERRREEWQRCTKIRWEEALAEEGVVAVYLERSSEDDLKVGWFSE